MQVEEDLLRFPIPIYKPKRYRIVFSVMLTILFFTFIINIDWTLLYQHGYALMWVALGLFIILFSSIYLLWTIIYAQPCMILSKQGIAFREYYHQQEKFFAWQDIQKFDFIFDSAFTVSVYLKEQSLLDVPQRFECGFYLKVQYYRIHAKQMADILQQCLIQYQNDNINIQLKDIPLTWIDYLNRWMYHHGSHRNYR